MTRLSLNNILLLPFRNIKTAGVSAVTGEGMSKLFGKIDEAALEFTECYLPDLARYANRHNDHNHNHSGSTC